METETETPKSPFRWQKGWYWGQARPIALRATNARTSPVTPQRAPRRWLSERAKRAERQSSPGGMVEGMMLSSKLLSIGRLPEFADSNISLRIAGIETIPSDGPSHKGRALLPAYTSPMLQEPAQWAQRGLGCPRTLLLRPAVGRFSEGAAESAHEAGPLAELTSSVASSPILRSPRIDSQPESIADPHRPPHRAERAPPRVRDLRPPCQMPRGLIPVPSLRLHATSRCRSRGAHPV